MPSVIYQGTFGGVSGSNGLTTTLSAISSITSVPAGAVITNVAYELEITAGGYSSSNDWVLDEIAVGGSGGSPDASDSATMYDNEHTFSGNMDYYASDVSKFSGDTIQVYAAAYTTHSSTSYLWVVKITVDYAFPSECVKPSRVTINGSTGTVETANNTATLAWSGAQAGSYNSIRGYLINYQDSTDGSTWGDIQTVGEVSTTATSGSVTVALPTVGTRRRFFITTCSALGSIYDSLGSAESPVVIRKAPISACGAPSDVALSAATSTGSNVTLSWKAGTAGNDNAITGYEVQRRESSNGSSWGSWAAYTTTTATSLSVAPPAAYDSYFQYRVRTLGAAGSSYYSGWVTSGTLQKVRPSLTAYTDPVLVTRTTKVKAIHMLELQTNINILRNGMGLSAYTFTNIQAGYTSLAGWNDHITELRTAIDGITTSHEEWLTLGDNTPRADVIAQLRRVVAAV